MITARVHHDTATNTIRTTEGFTVAVRSHVGRWELVTGGGARTLVGFDDGTAYDAVYRNRDASGETVAAALGALGWGPVAQYQVQGWLGDHGYADVRGGAHETEEAALAFGRAFKAKDSAWMPGDSERKVRVVRFADRMSRDATPSGYAVTVK